MNGWHEDFEDMFIERLEAGNTDLEELETLEPPPDDDSWEDGVVDEGGTEGEDEGGTEGEDEGENWVETGVVD